jgi:hypothetical protein
MTAATRDRLRAALRQPIRGEAPVRQDNVTHLNDLSCLGGRWFESPAGPGYVVESTYEAGYQHGTVPVHQALALDPAVLAPQCRDDRLAACDPGRFLYVDTETTGMGGAGTLVFLAGVAFFEGSLLRLQQYFLPSPDYEGGLLGGLAERLEGAAALVSYNGKSFDVPVLENRYILSRMRPAWRALPHLDLLHPNRRLFKGMFESHRLPRMEQELLGFEREDDCPSHEAPERYFRFQRSGDPTHLLPVLRHNAWDILSLVALAAHLAGVVGGERHPLQAGRAAEYAGDLGAAAGFFRKALAGDLAHLQRVDTLERLARALGRLDRWHEAADAWATLMGEPHYRRLLPCVELAKIYEHRLRDRERAFDVCEQALSLVRGGLLRPGDTGSLSLPALEHRHARLERTRKAT